MPWIHYLIFGLLCFAGGLKLGEILYSKATEKSVHLYCSPLYETWEEAGYKEGIHLGVPNEKNPVTLKANDKYAIEFNRKEKHYAHVFQPSKDIQATKLQVYDEGTDLGIIELIPIKN